MSAISELLQHVYASAVHMQLVPFEPADLMAEWILSSLPGWGFECARKG